MTREEAINEYKKIDKLQKKLEFANSYDLLIHTIYDDFESRTCSNCKHLSDNGCTLIGDWDCYNDDFIDWSPPFDDFGCNKFERKENEK